jgi:iron-regulated transporter 1
MRQIDLACKLLAPLFISFVDAFSPVIAIQVVLWMSSASVMVEYIAIAQVRPSSVRQRLLLLTNMPAV